MMEAVSTKMLRILVGMAGLQIQSTVIKEHDKSQQNPIQDDDWVSVGKPDETVDETDRKANGTKVYEELEDMTKGSNLYEVLQAVTNNFKLHQDVEGERNIDGKLHKTSIPRVANLPVLTRISTVLFGDDGQYETYDYIKFASVLISENQVDNKTLKQLDKGKTQLVFDSNDNHNEISSHKYFSSNYCRFSAKQVQQTIILKCILVLNLCLTSNK
jgi:hypothetical protein